MKILSAHTKVINDAHDIAKRSLFSCETDRGFVAGAHHFVDLWARDSLFATLGANYSGLGRVTRKTIETFLNYQRADGLVPYLVLRSRHTIGKYFGKHAFYRHPVAHFRSHMSFGLVPDGGVMAIIAAQSYAKNTNDTRFLKKNYPRLVAAFNWYELRFRGGLVTEWFQCEWADALLKVGKTLYTNVLYFQAARDMSVIAKRLGRRDDARKFAERAERLKKLLTSEFWNGSFFSDWKDWKRQDYFATHPNMLAIIFGLASKQQSRNILSTAKKYTWTGWTAKNSFPAYPLWRVPFFHIAIGMRDYHNGLMWLQPGILYAVALEVNGRGKDAQAVLSGIAGKILEFRGVHEVYEQNGTPVTRLVYRSEEPFAWSAGLFVWAYHILRKHS